MQNFMMLKPCSFYILITFAVVFFENNCFSVNAEKISDLRLCGDRSCQTLLSKARTLARHKPTDPAFLPFERGELISIYSKSAGSRQDLWGGELNGKRGYFPRSFVREYKVEYQNPQHIVETEHHVPLEERMRGSTERRQAPPNARTVQHGNRQSDRTDQEQTESDVDEKQEESSGDSTENQKEAVEEQKQAESETVDATDIGDETELPDEEQEVEKPETVLPDGAGQPSDLKTGSSDRKIQEEEKMEIAKSEDPTEVDETEISEEDTGSLEEGSEADQSENKSGTSDGKDETETGKNVDELERTEYEVQDDDQEQDVKETENETETEETELEEKEVEEAVDKNEKDELEKQDELAVAKDISADSGKNDNKMDNAEDHEAERDDKKEEAAERESDETATDSDEGSMFGSIWSAVVGSFQKKDTESEDTTVADATLTDEKKVEDEDGMVSGKDKPSDSEHVEQNLSDTKQEAREATEETEKAAKELEDVNDLNNENEVKYEETEVKEGDKKTEEILSNFEKTLEAIAEETSTEKDGSKDELKFIDDSGEIIQDELNIEQEDLKDEQMLDSYIKEMEKQREDESVKQEQGLDGRNFDHQKVGHVDVMTEPVHNKEEELDEQKMMNLEKLASGMISILATPTLGESSSQMSSYIVESTSDNLAQNTEMLDVHLSSDPLKTAQVKEEALIESITETTTEHDHTTVAVNQTQAGHAVESSEVKPGEQEDSGGVVIDGTTFPANYFGEETLTEQRGATQDIMKTTAVMDTSVHTPAGDVKPTKLFDVPVDLEQTLLPQDMQHNTHTDNQIPPYDQQLGQRNTDTTRNILATETQKEEFTNQEIKHSDKVSVLQTSFDFASQSVEDTFTLPVDQVRVAAETEVVGSNETVSSDNVQDEVQPSLDQNAYTTDIFISRKPLSTEPAPSEATAETEAQGQEVGKEKKPMDVEQKTTSQETDENNNDINKIVDEDSEKHSDWTIFRNERHEDESSTFKPTTLSPEEVDPFGADESVYSKVPDPSLDEGRIQSEDTLMKTIEPYLKTLINMLPPGLQSVLEQEPVGLSPTLTMLVTLISTNVLALLTCVGCLCKSEKKPSGRKDPIVVIRELEEKLFIATKEKENLEDDLQVKTKKLSDIQEELNSQQSTTGTVETDLKTIRLHNEALKKQLADIEEELADYKQEVTEKTQVVAYKDSELQTYLAEVHTQSQRAQDAELALQKTSQGLGEKEEELRVSLQQVQSLSEQVQQLETSKQQLQDEAVDWSEKVKELTEQIEQYSTSAKRMQEDLAFKENELEVLRDCFLQVKAFQGEEEMKEETEESPDLKEKLKQMMDVSRVNASLRSVEEERDVLQNKLLIEIESRKELEDQVQLLKRKFEGNQTDKMKAERQCQEAQTKLEVLSKYFKEKEAELTRQLGEQEVLKNQNISKLQSSDSITQELSKENETYRQQIEDLKTEISKAERDFRSQIAANEKKAHENWLATRAAERELKESRHECGMLRQKLTDLERKLMQGPPPGLIRPITHRAMPPPGMLNGPPPPPPERPGSRGSVHGHVTPRLRDEEYRASPVGPDRIPPPDRRHPPGPVVPRPPLPPLDAMSPPPYAIRPPFPPDRRSPPSFDRYPPPRGPRPPFPRPPPPHLRSPPNVGSIPSEHDDSRPDPSSPYNRAHPGSRDRGTARHQSQV